MGTVKSLLTPAQLGERTANRGIQVDLHVRITAVGFCAAAPDEVNAGGRSIWRKIMRKSTSRSSRTDTFHEELFAHSNLVDIVGEFAISGTLT